MNILRKPVTVSVPSAQEHFWLTQSGITTPVTSSGTANTEAQMHHTDGMTINQFGGTNLKRQRYILPTPAASSPSLALPTPAASSPPLALGAQDQDRQLEMEHVTEIPKNGPGDLTMEMQSEKQNSNKTHCIACGKWFHSRQQLAQHMLVHTDVRRYKCQFCDRAFKQPSHLHQHHRIHTGERPYKCTLPGCKRAFPQLSNLNHHLRNHDKPDPPSENTCMFCDRTYASEAVLRNHLLKIHKCDPNSLPGSKHSSPELLRQQVESKLAKLSNVGPQAVLNGRKNIDGFNVINKDTHLPLSEAQPNQAESSDNGRSIECSNLTPSHLHLPTSPEHTISKPDNDGTNVAATGAIHLSSTDASTKLGLRNGFVNSSNTFNNYGKSKEIHSNTFVKETSIGSGANRTTGDVETTSTQGETVGLGNTFVEKIYIRPNLEDRNGNNVAQDHNRERKNVNSSVMENTPKCIDLAVKNENSIPISRKFVATEDNIIKETNGCCIPLTNQLAFVMNGDHKLFPNKLIDTLSPQKAFITGVYLQQIAMPMVNMSKDGLIQREATLPTQQINSFIKNAHVGHFNFGAGLENESEQNGEYLDEEHYDVNEANYNYTLEGSSDLDSQNDKRTHDVDETAAIRSAHNVHGEYANVFNSRLSCDEIANGKLIGTSETGTSVNGLKSEQFKETNRVVSPVSLTVPRSRKRKASLPQRVIHHDYVDI